MGLDAGARGNQSHSRERPYVHFGVYRSKEP
jgi:hypothetical protein